MKLKQMFVAPPLGTNFSNYLKKSLKDNYERDVKFRAGRALRHAMLPLAIASILIAKPLADGIQKATWGGYWEGSHRYFISPPKVRLPGPTLYNWISAEPGRFNVSYPLCNAFYEYAPARIYSEKTEVGEKISSAKAAISGTESNLNEEYERVRDVFEKHSRFEKLQESDYKRLGKYNEYLNIRKEQIHGIWKLNFDMRLIRPKVIFSAVWAACAIALLALMTAIMKQVLMAAAIYFKNREIRK